MNSLLMEDDQVVEQPVQLEKLSQSLVARSIQFINTHAHDGKPFFLYHSFTQVHVPIVSGNEHRGKSAHGRLVDKNSLSFRCTMYTHAH